MTAAECEGDKSGASPTLRRLCTRDAPAVLAAFTASPDMARQGDVRTLEDAERYVQHMSDRTAGMEGWAIAEGERLVGFVGISVDRENRSGWVFYWMNLAARGRGWTSRAVATVSDWALHDLGLERLELGHRVNNPASGAVARAAGFLKEGTERGKFLVDGERIDVDTYGRLKSDPWPQHEPVRYEGPTS